MFELAAEKRPLKRRVLRRRRGTIDVPWNHMLRRRRTGTLAA